MFLEQVFTYRHKWSDYSKMILLILAMYTFVLWHVGLILGLSQNRNVYGDYLFNPSVLSAYEIVLFTCSAHIGAFLAFILFFKRIHKQSFMCLVSASKKFRWKRLLVGLGLTLLVYALYQGLPIMFHPEDVEFVFNANEFIPYVLFLIPIVLIQVATEELGIRSYVMQAVASVSGRVVIPIIVSASIFSAMHLQNPGVDNWWISLIYFLVSGLMYSIIAVLDDGIELCIGSHFVYNIMTFSFYDTMNNPSIFRLDQDPEIGAVTIAFEVLVSLVLLLSFSLIYHWNWRRLASKIDKPKVSQ